MNCRQIEEKITLYCEGLLEGDELWAVQDHLRNCEDCRKLADEMSELLRLTADIPQVPIPEGFDERLSAALALEGAKIRAEQAASAARPRKRSPWRAACAVAACFVIFFAVVAMAQDGQLTLPSDMVSGGAAAPEAAYDAADFAPAPAPEAAAPEAMPEAPAQEAPVNDSFADSSESPMYSPSLYNGLSSASDRGFAPKVMAEADAASAQMMDAMVYAMNKGDAEAFHYSLFLPAENAEMKGDTMQTYHEASSIQASVECLNQLASILGSGTVAYERVGGLLTVDGITYRLYTLENDMDAGFPADNPEEGFYDGIVQEDAPAEVQVIVRWTPEGLKAEFVPLTAEEEGNGDQETGNH